MKKCSRCKYEKNISEFHKNKYASDGLEYHCKFCESLRKKEKYDPNKYQTEEFKEKNRKRAKQFRREKKELAKLYAKRSAQKRKKQIAEINKKWRQKNKIKINAKAYVYRWVKAGKLVRPEKCNYCSKQCKPEGHHHDYSKPLDVIWLCKDCHVKETFNL